MTAQALARSLAAVARGLRRALQTRLRAERAAGAGEVLKLRAEVARALVDLDDRDFADAWAQTLVYLLLAARWLEPGRDPGEHLPARLARCDLRLAGLVTRLLRLAEVQALQRALDGVTLVGAEADDPVMHFYEAFLAAYDPRLRAARGVYFTPAPVVGYLVETTDAVLRDRLGLVDGLADAELWGAYAARRGLEVPPGVDATCPFVQVVDPAAGTGTFVIAVIRRAHATMLARWGGDPAAWSDYARERLLPRLRGVERMVAPWAISVLRLSMLLTETGVQGAIGAPVFVLGDTLAGPDVLAGPISVVLGNPPYEREKPETPGGGWIRESVGRALLADFVEPARTVGAGAHVKNLYNLYVYFWRWACWQVFERRPGAPGVVAMVTGASFLRGPGFIGMRAHLRRCAPQIHVLDLEGDRRGANASDNVFAVSVPVAATTLVRGELASGTGVEIHRAQGGGAEKLGLCARTGKLEQLEWTRVHGAGGAAWVADDPRAGFHAWPRLVDLFPWQHSGAQWKRTWPIASEPEVLARRWQALVSSTERGELFHETRDRRVEKRYPPLRSPGLELGEATGEAIAAATVQPPVRRYGFRALDRRHCLADARLGDFLRPTLWWVAGPRQVYLTSLLTGALGPGPAAMVSAEVPDLHYFCGRGGKDVIPLWRDVAGEQANIAGGALAVLRRWCGDPLGAEDVFAYAYALLSAPGYTLRFSTELRASGPRIPLTQDAELWAATVALGRRGIALHTFAAGVSGAARCVQMPGRQPTTVRHVDDAIRLFLGEACIGEFAPVPAAVWTYALSGYRPVPGWISGRLAGGAGRRSSRLDAIRCEAWTQATRDGLLELLWTVEATLALGPALDDALDRVCAGPCWMATELPVPAQAERREPEMPRRAE